MHLLPRVLGFSRRRFKTQNGKGFGAEIGDFIQKWSDLRTSLSAAPAAITDGVLSERGLADNREEGLLSHHGPQFSVWCSGDENVLCILLSDPQGVPETQLHQSSCLGKWQTLRRSKVR